MSAFQLRSWERHRLLNLYAASEDDSRALTARGLTPGAKCVRGANSADRQMHLEVAVVVLQKFHDVGSGPSTGIGETAGEAVREKRVP